MEVIEGGLFLFFLGWLYGVNTHHGKSAHTAKAPVF